MTPFPQGLDPAHTRPSRSRHLRRWVPFLLLGLLLTCGLAGAFGGDRAQWRRVHAPAADFLVRMPHVMRNGVFFEIRTQIRARRDMSDAVIAVDPALWRDMTINTMFPEPAEQEYRNGTVRLSYGPLRAGERIEAKFDGQINPVLLGGTKGAMALFDGDRSIAELPLDIRVFP